MSKHVQARSVLHGHRLALNVEGIENRWYLPAEGASPEETTPYPLRVNHPVISHLLIQAALLDLRGEPDQPYMPEPHTDLQEALQHLQQYGSLGVQGGLICWDATRQTFTVRVLRHEMFPEAVVCNWQEISDLLKSNYPRKA